MFSNMYKLMVSVVIVVITQEVRAKTDESDLGHGFQIFSKIVRRYFNDQSGDVKLGDGVHLVSTADLSDARSSFDGSLLGSIEGYLRTHEIRIKLPELLPEKGFGRSFKNVMESFEDNEIGVPRTTGGGGLGGGGGKGGGGGGLALLGLMMGKMMAALGLGGVGLLAMKALMVSAMALMLSLIIGLKKLVSSDHDDGGHTVIHASPGGHGYDHRRKREAADMAYHSWSNQYQTS